MQETSTAVVSHEEFDEIDAILDDLRSRFEETPQWEFCEGFLAAVAVSRRPIEMEEIEDVLLGISEHGKGENSFKDAAQRSRFMDIWGRRFAEVKSALSRQVESLAEEGAYQPEILDVRGAIARLSPEEQAKVPADEIPSFAQVWALGFMYAVESWPEEWDAPRDKKAAKWLDESLDAIVALTEDDDGPAEISPFDEADPPTMSKDRFDAFADAMWAVYDLREIWASLGPRVEQIRKTQAPGRNDPCSCGSGKKFKKCCGAAA